MYNRVYDFDQQLQMLKFMYAWDDGWWRRKLLSYRRNCIVILNCRSIEKDSSIKSQIPLRYPGRIPGLRPGRRRRPV